MVEKLFTESANFYSDDVQSLQWPSVYQISGQYSGLDLVRSNVVGYSNFDLIFSTDRNNCANRFASSFVD